MPATPPPPADIRTRGGCSYGGSGLLRYALRRSTALGAKRVCRQLRRRRQAFAPGAGAPTVGSGFSDMFRVGAPPPVRNGAAGSSAPPYSADELVLVPPRHVARVRYKR